MATCVTGVRRPINLYYVDIYLGDSGYSGIRVMADIKGKEIILGRDLLNKLPVLLDGTQQQTVILDDVTVNRLRQRL